MRCRAGVCVCFGCICILVVFQISSFSFFSSFVDPATGSTSRVGTSTSRVGTFDKVWPHHGASPPPGSAPTPPPAAGEKRTLVVFHYAVAHADGTGGPNAALKAAASRRNLDFFLRVGVSPGADYMFNVFARDRAGTAALVEEMRWALWEAEVAAARPRSRPIGAGSPPPPPPLPPHVVINRLEEAPRSDMCQHHNTIRELEERGELSRCVLANPPSYYVTT